MENRYSLLDEFYKTYNDIYICMCLSTSSVENMKYINKGKHSNDHAGRICIEKDSYAFRVDDSDFVQCFEYCKNKNYFKDIQSCRFNLLILIDY